MIASPSHHINNAIHASDYIVFPHTNFMFILRQTFRSITNFFVNWFMDVCCNENTTFNVIRSYVFIVFTLCITYTWMEGFVIEFWIKEKKEGIERNWRLRCFKGYTLFFSSRNKHTCTWETKALSQLVKTYCYYNNKRVKLSHRIALHRIGKR